MAGLAVETIERIRDDRFLGFVLGRAFAVRHRSRSGARVGHVSNSANVSCTLFPFFELVVTRFVTGSEFR